MKRCAKCGWGFAVIDWLCHYCHFWRTSAL
jgi:hypothetical protein